MASAPTNGSRSLRGEFSPGVLVTFGSMADVEAAGGVVCRLTKKGHLEVLVVHRPHHDDWSFPKGKLDPGEDHASAARREVDEETGYRCALTQQLPSARYTLSSGLTKRVKYWLMLVEKGKFAKNSEVDEIAWLTPKKARKKLSHGTDKDVLADALEALGI